MKNEPSSAYRLLPSVEELLQSLEREGHSRGVARPVAARLVSEVLDRIRTRIRQGELVQDGVAAWVAAGGPVLAAAKELYLERGRGLVRVINTTGVVLNTGLGRAPLHPEAAEAMAIAARSYCTVEVDRFSGARNQRDARTGELLSRLTGAEAGIAVNNCAAAVFLTLQTFAGGRACVLSRGELVEIGGSFRMPDVMARAGVRLVEVGTTNKTRLADYRGALSPEVGLLLKVHTSNFRVVGFVEEVSAEQLSRLAREAGVPSAYDLGSGLIDPPGARPLDFLGDEPGLREALASGIDVVMFSGDKLLGGPQAGLIVGRREAVEALRNNPLYRALRLDKVALAGLERTLELLLDGRADELPVRALLWRSPAEIQALASSLAATLDALPDLSAEVVPGHSQPGSGSAPDVFLETFCVQLCCEGRSAEDLAQALRAGDPPVFARIKDGRVLLDPRTLLPGEDEDLVRACAQIRAGRPRR